MSPDGDAELLRVLQPVGDRGRLEQRLGRDAAPEHAGAAERLALDDGGGEAELGAADRADVAGGTAAEEDDVVGSHGRSRSSIGAWRGRSGPARRVSVTSDNTRGRVGGNCGWRPRCALRGALCGTAERLCRGSSRMRSGSLPAPLGALARRVGARQQPIVTHETDRAEAPDCSWRRAGCPAPGLNGNGLGPAGGIGAASVIEHRAHVTAGASPFSPDPGGRSPDRHGERSGASVSSLSCVTNPEPSAQHRRTGPSRRGAIRSSIRGNPRQSCSAKRSAQCAKRLHRPRRPAIAALPCGARPRLRPTTSLPTPCIRRS